MDEYIGLPENALKSLALFLKEKIFGLVPFRSLNYINGNAPDALAECGHYAELLLQYPPDLVCLGIEAVIRHNDIPANIESIMI